MNLRLDSPPFDLLYANVTVRANSCTPKLPSNPRQGPATHRLNVIDIFSSKSFLVDFIPGNERFPINFVLPVAAKDDQTTPIKVASIGGTETRLAIGATARSSSFHKVGNNIDVLAGGSFSTTEASQTPKDNGAEDDDDEDPLLDAATKTTTLGERASDERDTLRTHRLWINFFTIFAMARLKR
jgi:hypothetical protein